MAIFKLTAFSKKLPLKFKFCNALLLLPILLWPFVLFGTFFLFDAPNANPTKVWLQFLGIIFYPLYLIILAELNARLYLRNRLLAYVLPLLLVGSLATAIGYSFYKEQQFVKKSKEAIIAKTEKRKAAGYIGACNTYRIKEDQVYYKETALQADPDSFTYLACQYAKDKNTAFSGKNPIRGSHAKTFTVINALWQKDKDQYYLEGKAIKNLDYQSFTPLPLLYAKDKYRVYYKTKPLVGASPKSFKVNSSTKIATDGKNRFKNGQKIAEQ